MGPDSKQRLWPCDNCGRRHFGFYRDEGAWDTGPEWNFIWTDRDGLEKRCERGHERFPCTDAHHGDCNVCVWAAVGSEGAEGE